MIREVVVALFHNKISCVTLGSTPQCGVPLPVAHWLKPVLESNTSLKTFTLHTQYIPPESLKVILLGAAYCRGLQHLRLVGGISVLQSSVLMSVMTHFTFAGRMCRPSTATRGKTPNGEWRGGVQHANRPLSSEAATRRNRRLGVNAFKLKKGNVAELHDSPLQQRLRSPAPPNPTIARPPLFCAQRLSGVHVVLDVQHMDDVVAGFLVRGLEKAERIVGFDVHISSVCQTACRATARLLARTGAIVKHNAERHSDMLARYRSRVGGSAWTQPKARNAAKLCTSPHSPLFRPSAGVDDDATQSSSSHRRDLPTRRYSPPQLLPEHLPQPHSPTPRPQGAAVGPHRLFSTADVVATATDNCTDMKRSTRVAPSKRCEGEEGKVRTGGANDGQPDFPSRKHVSPEVQPLTFSLRHTERCEPDSAALGPPTPHYKPHAPLEQQLSRQGQLIQQMRYLRGSVRELNSAVVRYQVVSREAVQKMATTMQQLEKQLTESVTHKLADMLVMISEVEGKEL